ncbi:MAG: hypothetical protein J7L39_03275 [Candidatus Aenigmarchaeota archaeon]|nr:hypothetical protein [Candidatus Aenigmarchaeota archaeon]
MIVPTKNIDPTMRLMVFPNIEKNLYVFQLVREVHGKLSLEEEKAYKIENIKDISEETLDKIARGLSSYSVKISKEDIRELLEKLMPPSYKPNL